MDRVHNYETCGLYKYNINSTKRIQKTQITIVRGGINMYVYKFVLTCNGKYLITIDSYGNLDLYSVRTNQKLFGFGNPFNSASFECFTSTLDSRYIFIGYSEGFVIVFDIKKQKLAHTVKIYWNEEDVISMVMAKDGKKAYILGVNGWIKTMEWKPDQTDGHIFWHGECTKVKAMFFNRI